FSYTLCNYAGCILHITYVCTAIFLIAVVNTTQIHQNCKFLLSLWGAAYAVQFASHGAVFAWNAVITVLPAHKYDPQLRSYLVDTSAASQLFCEILEIIIASERILSSVKPAEYHVSGRNNRLLIPLVVCLLTASFIQAYLVEVNLLFVAGPIIFILEICSLTLNRLAVKYCERRHVQLQRSSLNARYQVKEACELAVSMQRVYLITFAFKNLVNGIAIIFCYDSDDQHNCVPLVFPLPYYILEEIYGIGATTTSEFLLVSLLYNHPRLRKNSRALLGKIKGSTSVEVAFSPPQFESVKDAYFGALQNAW
ncbi:hypothetical protein PENTCL1PPCAC_24079, partial [Pristionchus entomophagus]